MADHNHLTIDFKSTAEFWLDNLFDDEYFKDGSLVVNPCNSPEQTPTSFGCTHYQQLIWELFNAVEKASTFVGETDQAFLSGTSLTVL
jgi:alpha-L-fucosidase 2